MSAYRFSVFYLCLAVLCVFSGSSLSKKTKNTSETAPLNQPSSDDPPSEPSFVDESPSDHQTTAENAVDPSEESEKVEDEAAKQEKLVVAFVPDYPSK